MHVAVVTELPECHKGDFIFPPLVGMGMREKRSVCLCGKECEHFSFAATELFIGFKREKNDVLGGTVSTHCQDSPSQSTVFVKRA